MLGRIPSKALAGLLFFSLLSISHFAWSAEAIEVADVSKRPFEVSLAGLGPEDLAYGDAIVFSIRVFGLSEKAEFSDFKPLVLGELSSLYELSESEGQSSLTFCRINGPSTLEKGGELVATCQIHARDGAKFWRPSAWWLSPKQQRVSVLIPRVVNGTEIAYYYEVPVFFRASLDAILAGGLSGAFLLALFGAVKERAYAKIEVVNAAGVESIKTAFSALISWLLNLPLKAWTVVLQTLMGGICAVILIVLAQSTEGLTPPISIKVQDFWGGVVIGLFSIPLSKWIWSHVRPEAAQQPPAKPVGVSNGDGAAR